jgi:dehydratase
MNAPSLGAPATAASGGTGGPGGVEGAPGVGGAPGDAGLLSPIFGGTDAPTVGNGGDAGAVGSTGQVGSTGLIFGSWSNGVSTAPDFEGTPPTTTTTTPPEPTPVYTPVAMSCFTSAAGQSSYDTNNTGATVLAPLSVAAGSDFVVEITPDPVQVPSSAGGYSIGSLSNVKVSLAVPAGAAFVSASLSGGSNLGSGTPSVAQSGGKVTLTVPGPLAPGSTAVLPKLSITFQATGGPGTLIESKFAGSSYSNPGLTFTVAVTGTPIGTITATSNCYAQPNPVLATTEVR